MMLGLVRRIPAYVHDKDNRQFRRHQPYPAEIAGTTALLVGVGSIGSEIARRCKGLDMRVIALVRDTTKHCQWADELYPIDQLNEVVGQADHIFLTLPGGPETEKLINRSVLSACRSTAYLYNVSRGSVVDEAALYEWLRDGRLAGAGLDVAEVEPLPVDSPLWTLGDQVLITGHSAGISMGFPDRFCSLVIRNLTRFMANQTLENQVLPSYENH